MLELMTHQFQLTQHDYGIRRYPLEDEDIRARDQRWSTGGNASNSSKVLSLLGRKCEFLGTLGKGTETE